MILRATWNADQASLLAVADSGLSYSCPVSTIGDPSTIVSWCQVHDDVLAFLAAGGQVQAAGTPPPAPPVPDPQLAIIAAGGAARQQRIIRNLAETDPVQALLIQGGLK